MNRRKVVKNAIDTALSNTNNGTPTDAVIRQATANPDAIDADEARKTLKHLEKIGEIYRTGDGWRLTGGV